METPSLRNQLAGRVPPGAFSPIHYTVFLSALLPSSPEQYLSERKMTGNVPQRLFGLSYCLPKNTWNPCDVAVIVYDWRWHWPVGDQEPAIYILTWPHCTGGRRIEKWSGLLISKCYKLTVANPNLQIHCRNNSGMAGNNLSTGSSSERGEVKWRAAHLIEFTLTTLKALLIIIFFNITPFFTSFFLLSDS